MGTVLSIYQKNRPRDSSGQMTDILDEVLSKKIFQFLHNERYNLLT